MTTWTNMIINQIRMIKSRTSKILMERVENLLSRNRAAYNGYEINY